MHNDKSEFLTAREAARLLRLSPAGMRDLLRRGELPAVHLSERKTLVRRETLERFIAERERGAATILS